ncbi:MAG: hypothetical protein NTU41_13440 [Chloroflexi bacterium]|nr:hypothetical protein [Chloroflexota bacterium]
MPVPFNDSDELEKLGSAGYLRIVASEDRRGFRGALFLMNARGEPVEFTYNQIEIPSAFLWRHGDLTKHAARRLTMSLLDTCPRVPSFLICLASEIGHELFCQEIQLSIPVCRVASLSEAIPHSSLEVEVSAQSSEPLHLFWFPGKPADSSTEHGLFDRLITGGLILEPFERCLVGLQEVYSSCTDSARP